MANKKITDLMSGTPTRDSLLESATDVGGTMVSRKFKVGAVADVNNVQIASEYDDTATYAYGAYCIKDGVLHRCTTAISVAEAWDSTHWTAVMVTGEYKRVRIMTKAQFDLLSNDEKDGFIYVSDYPTKIQDIDNVTLTTSDNNKLLGSFVENGEVVVRAVNPKYTTGNVITLSGGIGCGQLGYNKVIFFIPLAKQIDTNAVNTCTINLTLTVFGVRADANVTVISSQNVTLDTAIITENGINLEVNNPNYQNYNSGLCWVKVEGTGTITLGHT